LCSKRQGRAPEPRLEFCYQMIANISRQPRCSRLREAGRRGDSRSRTKHRESRTLHWPPQVAAATEGGNYLTIQSLQRLKAATL
jgi:hypothetical protein